MLTVLSFLQNSGYLCIFKVCSKGILPQNKAQNQRILCLPAKLCGNTAVAGCAGNFEKRPSGALLPTCRAGPF
ncbi:MAG TPA: hypothetical protein DEV98_03865 [Clostridiales bacterium]|nr:hypothetical protein [Clostridiales bacterium]